MTTVAYYVLQEDFKQYAKPWERAAKFLKQTFNITEKTQYSFNKTNPVFYVYVDADTGRLEWPHCVRQAWFENATSEDNIRRYFINVYKCYRLKPSKEEILIV